jgi:hypothetical protein
MNKIKFNPIIKDHNLYDGFVKDGLLISEDRGIKSKTYLFVIGLEISYDTIDFHDYNKFILYPFPDQLIHNMYDMIFPNIKINSTNNYDILKFKFQKIFEFRNSDRYDIFKLFGIDLSTKQNFIVNREYIDNLIER